MPLADDVRIVPLLREHWPAAQEVYTLGIATGQATFETGPPEWEAFDAGRLPGHRHAAVSSAGTLLGWVAASAVSDRCAYAGVVEHSVYVHPAASGRGVGRRLLEALIASTEAAGIWTIQCGVFPENASSLALHERAGFRVVGIRRRLGRMRHGPDAGRWRDVVLLERRSDVVGAGER